MPGERRPGARGRDRQRELLDGREHHDRAEHVESHEQRGDTFGSIAAKVGTTISALETLNPGVSSTALQVGQKIRVK